jgi:hypothetical protein
MLRPPMFTRLTREQPWKAQIGCGAVIALAAAAPGVFIAYMTYFHDHSDNRGKTFAFAAVWIVVGLFIFLGTIHQALASRSPETVVEIEPAELAPGEALRIRILQPGPLRLLSLHANLAGEETTIATGGGRRTRTTRYLGPHRMLEVERQQIGAADTLQRDATFIVPDVAASGEASGVSVQWKIEVWGRVSMWPDFMHPFPVKVVLRPPAT